MAKNPISVAIDTDDARGKLERADDAVEEGASDAVKQLAVLAEGAQKSEAPEGTGRDQHLRDSIDTKFRRQGKTANVGARKRASDGTLLAIYIVEGTDPSSYSGDSQPPYGPLVEWAEAKLGDPGLGYAIAERIGERGHRTLPNDYVDRSVDEWEDEVDQVAGEQVRDALSRLFGGAV